MGNYYLYVVAYWVTRSLPRQGAYFLAIILADCHFYWSKEDRLAVESNLKVALQVDHVPWQSVRDVFRNFGKYLADFFTQTKYLDNDFIAKHVLMKNTHHLNDVINEHQGCIIISAHLGNWELAGAVLSKLGYPISIVALPHQDNKVNQFFNDQREFFGTTIIPTNTAIRRCIEHLKDNRIVAILAERDFTQHGIRMNFLGKPTLIPKGAALFSLKTGAPLLPTFFLRKPNGDFEINFLKPIYPPTPKKSKYSDKDVEEYMRRYIVIIEDAIKQNPTQWLMFRRFEA